MTRAPNLVNILLCVLMVLVDTQGSRGCLEKERLGLLDIKHFFYSHAGFSSWEVLLPSWVDDMKGNCCRWERVQCNPTTGRVTHLLLYGLPYAYEYAFADMITMNFSLLLPFEQLLYLDLSDNALNGSLGTKGLCGLKYLEELSINGISIVNLPECVGNLTTLRVLDLSSTSMTGNVPSFVTSLKSLEYLSLANTYIDGFFSFNLLANHSKLEVFVLSTFADNLHVETESSQWLPTFQLKVLQLRNCNLNAQQHGIIPKFLAYQHELRVVDLSQNMLQGEFPTWLLNNNSKLEFLLLTNNSLTGTFQLPTSIHGLLSLEISSNKIGGQLPKDIGKIFPNLSSVNVAKNFFEGHLPSSMVEMQRLRILDLSNNKFSGVLARNFFSNWTSLTVLRLSHNNFSGQAIPKFANSTQLRHLFLNDNLFEGELVDGISDKTFLEAIDISNNMISGKIPKSILNCTGLEILSISHNFLEDELPREICLLSSLTFLDLSENSLFGVLPDCLDKMFSLNALHLQKNTLTGSITAIPQSLISLDVRDNKFKGELPSLPMNDLSLEVLLLGGNQLNGSIPDELCHMRVLKMLDLSRNKFTGTIPSCFVDLITFPIDPVCEKQQSIPSCGKDILSYSSIFGNILHRYYSSTLMLNFSPEDDDDYLINNQIQAEFTTKHNSYSYSGIILELMRGLDFSSNELNGSIPTELGYIRNISSLNLSHNHISGSIPQSFSNLKRVESLDLSYNNLSGAIPPSLTELHFLAIFNVSYNNLSGPTPITGQFANFDEDNYRGNPSLYGFPNGSSNRNISPPPPPSKIISNEGGENDTAIELVSFYWGFSSSYVTIVLGLAITLWLSPRCCRVWFRFVDFCIYYCFPSIFRNGFR